MMRNDPMSMNHSKQMAPYEVHASHKRYSVGFCDKNGTDQWYDRVYTHNVSSIM